MPAIEPISAEPPHRVDRPIMRQTWRDVTFLHWRYEPDGVRKLLPADLQLDLFNGEAWVGLVPFFISGLTLPSAPAVPWLSNFAETNVRTYVIDRHGRRGVWFFSLDAARLPAVIAARAAYALPYFWARMRVDRRGESVRYTSKRRFGPKAASRIEVQIGEPLSSPTELEVFLTARFRLYAKRFGGIVKADVEHPPWPLHRASVVHIEQTLVSAAGLAHPQSPPLVHFAHRVDVRAAWPTRL